MEGFMNEEIDWDHNVEGDAVEGPVDCGGIDQVVQTLEEIKTGKISNFQMYHWS